MKLKAIKGVIFDYGGTIDTNSRHWAEVLWEKYQQAQVPVSREAFREAYVHGERTLAKHPFIRPEHNFHDVLAIKTKIQTDYLVEQNYLKASAQMCDRYAANVAQLCYDYVNQTLETTRPVVQLLAERYKLTLVSNFYGNIQTILTDFGLKEFFPHIIESAVVGVRKPNPAIYQLGVIASGIPAEECLVIGDSYTKDMIPAKAVGCQTVWLKGEGWEEEEIVNEHADAVITNLNQLPALLP